MKYSAQSLRFLAAKGVEKCKVSLSLTHSVSLCSSQWNIKNHKDATKRCQNGDHHKALSQITRSLYIWQVWIGVHWIIIVLAAIFVRPLNFFWQLLGSKWPYVQLLLQVGPHEMMMVISTSQIPKSCLHSGNILTCTVVLTVLKIRSEEEEAPRSLNLPCRY